MIDLHSHICYGIDDGSKSIEESIELLKHLANNGTTDLFLTPHYIEDSKYNANQNKEASYSNNILSVDNTVIIPFFYINSSL